jgi:hypothetical protein
MERLRDALAAIEALEAERDEARANCDLLHGLKFSERNHRAILARAEGAEAEVRALRAQAAAPAEETGQARHCTCHPDDHPPQPCAKRYAYSECVASVGPPAAEPPPVTWDDEQPDPCHERVMALATELGELKAENKRLRFGPPAAPTTPLCPHGRPIICFDCRGDDLALPVSRPPAAEGDVACPWCHAKFDGPAEKWEYCPKCRGSFSFAKPQPVGPKANGPKIETRRIASAPAAEGERPIPGHPIWCAIHAGYFCSCIYVPKGLGGQSDSPKGGVVGPPAAEGERGDDKCRNPFNHSRKHEWEAWHRRCLSCGKTETLASPSSTREAQLDEMARETVRGLIVDGEMSYVYRPFGAEADRSKSVAIIRRALDAACADCGSQSMDLFLWPATEGDR